MIQKTAAAFIFALLLLTAPGAAEVPEAGTDDSRAGMCEDFSGLAFGFCVALCEARECDLQSPGDERCAVLRRGFERVTGGHQPPC
jgi:hypothetical protein